VPEFPVVSKTGHLFERSVIVKYLEANGKCPISGEPMSVEDLVPLKGIYFFFLSFYLSLNLS
jgi:pre-mRNA-processing factor 19